MDEEDCNLILSFILNDANLRICFLSLQKEIESSLILTNFFAFTLFISSFRAAEKEESIIFTYPKATLRSLDYRVYGIV